MSGHFADQGEFEVRCEWGAEGLRAVLPRTELVIVVDVLSFTTAVAVAVGRGAKVYPHRWKDASAEVRAAELGATLARARGTNGYSLSPVSMQNARAGESIVFASPNGATVSFEAADKGAEVICACFRNIAAIGRYASQFQTVAVIATGERWADGSLRPAVEDIACAGAVIAELRGRARSPEAEAAVAIWEKITPKLGEVLRRCSSGRQLIEMGYPGDIAIAAELNASDSVPVLRNGAYERVLCAKRICPGGNGH